MSTPDPVIQIWPFFGDLCTLIKDTVCPQITSSLSLIMEAEDYKLKYRGCTGEMKTVTYMLPSLFILPLQSHCLSGDKMLIPIYLLLF